MSLNERVKFDHIRYANVWEDAEVLLEALGQAAGRRMASIASAGDNSFALLLTDPEQVVAFDINPVQLHLCELKTAAIRTLPREEVLAFLGFKDAPDRLETFANLKGQLSSQAREYWENNSELIQNGVIHQGKFERYFRLFAHRILPWIHSKKRVAKLFEPKSESEQVHFYTTQWNTWRWRLFFRIFFSRTVMGKKGRDPEFLRQVEGTVSRFIFRKAEHHLKTVAAQTNPILYYTLNGHFGNHLPLYLQEKHFETIRLRLDRIEWTLGTPETLNDGVGFDAFNLSDVFEYMDQRTFFEQSELLLKAARPGAIFAYWNLMVPRRMSTVFPQQLQFEKQRAHDLTLRDRGFFYNCLIIDTVNEGRPH